MSSKNGPMSSAKSGCSVLHLYISKSATFTLTLKLFFTGEAFHYTSTNHDNHYVSGFNDSSICHRRAKMNHNKKIIIKIRSVVFKISPFKILATVSWHSLAIEIHLQFLAYT